MNDLTLLSANWNQQTCVEMMLKSYVKHHYTGEPLKLMLVDNGSSDGSKEWLRENGIPFYDFAENIGHENAVNALYEELKTKYALLVDTDVEFKDNIYGYSLLLEGEYTSAGEMIDKNYINSTKIKDRISPWFLMWDVKSVKESGIEIFRDPNCQDWTYDVASWFTEEMQKKGFRNYHIERENGDQDNDIISMRYEKFNHWGKMSWDVINKHQDRIGEVLRRRSVMQTELKKYSDIQLKGKFIYG